MEETLELLGQGVEAFRAEALASIPPVSASEPRKRFKAINRKQLMIRPVDVEKLVEEDDPVRAIWAMVCELDWSRFEDEAVGVNWPGQEDVIAGLRDGERQCKEFESHCVGFGSADTHTAVLKNLQVVSARWQLGEEDVLDVVHGTRT